MLPRLDDEKLPSWFTAADLKYYADNYNKSSFTGPLNYYRNLDRYIWTTVLAALTLSSSKLPERIITNLKYIHLRLNREEAGAAEGSFKIVMKLVGQGLRRGPFWDCVSDFS